MDVDWIPRMQSFPWLIMESAGGVFEHGDEPSHSIQKKEFLDRPRNLRSTLRHFLPDRNIPRFPL
jgi:hypothetical protein